MRLFSLLLCVSPLVCGHHTDSLVSDQGAHTVPHRLPRQVRRLFSKETNPYIQELSVKTTIISRYAFTAVSCTMFNKLSAARLGIFRMEIPASAFISNFTMIVAGRVFPSQIKAKEKKAKQQNGISNQALKEGQEGKGSKREVEMFQAAATVPGKNRAVFLLTYEELLVRRRGLYEHVTIVRPQQLVGKLSVQVVIVEHSEITHLEVLPLRNGLTPANKSTADSQGRVGPPVSTVIQQNKTFCNISFSPSIAQQAAIATSGVLGDFIVQYDVKRELGIGEVQVLDGHFVHYFAPKDLPVVPKNVVFVIDTSASMLGTKIRQTKEALFTILRDLRPNDYFNFVSFSSRIKVWKPGKLVPVTPNNIRDAKKFIHLVSPTGATNINLAIETGSGLLRNHLSSEGSNCSSVSLLIFLTDGRPTVGEVQPPRILSNAQLAVQEQFCIFTIGLGDDVDYRLLQRLALDNCGTMRRIPEQADASAMLKGFYDEIGTPLLSDVRIEYSQDAVEYVTQHLFSNYFNGSEIVIAGKLTNQSADSIHVQVTASNSNGSVVLESDVMLREREKEMEQHIETAGLGPLGDKYVERLWGFLSVKDSLKSRLLSQSSQERDESTQQATNLSLTYNFLTPLTTMVVETPSVEVRDPVSDSIASPSTETTGESTQSLPSDTKPLDSSAKKPAEELIKISKTSADGDPHFVVEFPLSKLTMCFNINGEPGHVLRLVSDHKHSGVTVNGMLVGAPAPVGAHKQQRTYFSTIAVVVDRPKRVYLEITPYKVTLNGTDQLVLPCNTTAAMEFEELSLTIIEQSNVTITIQGTITFVILIHLYKNPAPFQRDHLGFYISNNKGLSENCHGLLGQFLYQDVSLTQMFGNVPGPMNNTDLKLPRSSQSKVPNNTLPLPKSSYFKLSNEITRQTSIGKATPPHLVTLTLQPELLKNTTGLYLPTIITQPKVLMQTKQHNTVMLTTQPVSPKYVQLSVPSKSSRFKRSTRTPTTGPTLTTQHQRLKNSTQLQVLKNTAQPKSPTEIMQKNSENPNIVKNVTQAGATKTLPFNVLAQAKQPIIQNNTQPHTPKSIQPKIPTKTMEPKVLTENSPPRTLTKVPNDMQQNFLTNGKQPSVPTKSKQLDIPTWSTPLKIVTKSMQPVVPKTMQSNVSTNTAKHAQQVPINTVLSIIPKNYKQYANMPRKTMQPKGLKQSMQISVPKKTSQPNISARNIKLPILKNNTKLNVSANTKKPSVPTMNTQSSVLNKTTQLNVLEKNMQSNISKNSVCDVLTKTMQPKDLMQCMQTRVLKKNPRLNAVSKTMQPMVVKNNTQPNDPAKTAKPSDPTKNTESSVLKKSPQLNTLSKTMQPVVVKNNTQPRDPTKTTKPSVPTKTTQLNNVTKTTESMVVKNNTQPRDPTKTTQLNNVTKTTEPMVVKNNTQSNVPIKTTKPSDPVKNTESSVLKKSPQLNALSKTMQPMVVKNNTQPRDPTKTTEPMVVKNNTQPNDPAKTAKPSDPAKNTESSILKKNPQLNALSKTMQPMVVKNNTQPRDPTKTTKPSVPTKTTQLNNVTKTTEPMVVKNNTQPRDPTKTTKPSVPIKTTQLNNVTKTIEPMVVKNNTQSNVPIKTTKPSDPVKNTESSVLKKSPQLNALSKTMQPMVVKNNTQPNDPAKTAKPSDPAKNTESSVLKKSPQLNALSKTMQPMVVKNNTQPRDPTKTTQLNNVTKTTESMVVKNNTQPRDPTKTKKPSDPAKNTQSTGLKKTPQLNAVSKTVQPMMSVKNNTQPINTTQTNILTVRMQHSIPTKTLQPKVPTTAKKSIIPKKTLQPSGLKNKLPNVSVTIEPSVAKMNVQYMVLKNIRNNVPAKNSHPNVITRMRLKVPNGNSHPNISTNLIQSTTSENILPSKVQREATKPQVSTVVVHPKNSRNSSEPKAQQNYQSTHLMEPTNITRLNAPMKTAQPMGVVPNNTAYNVLLNTTEPEILLNASLTREAKVPVDTVSATLDPLNPLVFPGLKIKGRTISVTQKTRKMYGGKERVECWFVKNSASKLIDGQYEDYVVPHLFYTSDNPHGNN